MRMPIVYQAMMKGGGLFLSKPLFFKFMFFHMIFYG